MASSWSHALHPPSAFAEYEVGVQKVPVESAEAVLEAAAELADGSDLVVKVNTEGEECEIVLATPTASWSQVAEALVETHPWATCTNDELTAHLTAAGLIPAESPEPAVLRLVAPQRRGGSPRSDGRTAPT
jgi:hypothetical protein